MLCAMDLYFKPFLYEFGYWLRAVNLKFQGNSVYNHIIKYVSHKLYDSLFGTCKSILFGNWTNYITFIEGKGGYYDLKWI